MEFLYRASGKTHRISQNWINSVRGVMLHLYEGLGECLNATDNRMLEELFKKGQTVIIETKGLIGPLESFVVAFILLFLREFHAANGYVGGLCR